MIIGHFCGHDNATDYKYLFIHNISKAIHDPKNLFSTGLCVKSCPTLDKNNATFVYNVDCYKTSYLTNNSLECTPKEHQYGSKSCKILTFIFLIYV